MEHRALGWVPVLPMFARLVFFFVLVPVLELLLLLELGRWVGFWPTAGLVVGTGVLGAALARAEGLRTWIAFQREVGAGKLPGTPLLDGLAVLVGGAFLLTPGLLTDLAGLTLLFPPTRRWLQRRIRRRLERAVESGHVQMRVWTPFGWTGGPPGAGGGAGPGWPGGNEELDPRHEIRQPRRGSDEEQDG